MSRPRVIGNYLSPYVRKVLACLELKGLDYEIDPIVPFTGNAAFVAHVLAQPTFVKLARYEDAMLRLPLAEQRAALLAVGAPLSSDTLGTEPPRHGLPRG